MTLDFGTLSLAGGLVAFVSGLLLIFAWTQYDASRPALWLGLSHLLGASAIMLLAAGTIGHTLLPALAQPLFVLASSLTLFSIAAFEGRTGPIPLLAGAGVATLACVGPLVAGAEYARTFQLAATSILFGVSAYLLWVGRNERLGARLPLVMIVSLHSLMNAVGVAEAVAREASPSGVPSFSEWYGLIHIESMVYFIGSALFMVALIKERSEARHKSASLSDPLTGLPNRRAFFDLCDKTLARCHRAGFPCTMVAIDLDRFKAVNDTFGHAMGDRVLRVFAETASGQLRPFDVVGRLGGEEFAALLPRTHSREGAEIARRLTEAFAEAARVIEGEEVRATLSAGVAVVFGTEATISQALERADAALYRAKLNGRDRVEVDTGIQSVRPSTATG